MCLLSILILTNLFDIFFPFCAEGIDTATSHPMLTVGVVTAFSCSSRCIYVEEGETNIPSVKPRRKWRRERSEDAVGEWIELKKKKKKKVVLTFHLIKHLCARLMT